MKNEPPFDITPLILKLSQDIAHELGVLTGAKLTPAPVKLRRENKIKTIQSSLAIEGNTLSLEQITHIFDGKRVVGPRKDIQEVNNAIELYDDLSKLNPLSINALLRSHKILMRNLIAQPGKWRTGGVGVFKGQKVSHIAPPAKRVPNLMENLFQFLKGGREVPWLIKACVFHYELEFIHPFADGNGRMGRLWQQLLLMKEDSVFEYFSVEAIIRSHQTKYYRVLEKCDKKGDSTLFVEFALEQILIALREYSQSAISPVVDAQSRIAFAKEGLGKKWFSRADYLRLHKDISTATASRDLQKGLKAKLLTKKGEKNQVKYRFN